MDDRVDAAVFLERERGDRPAAAVVGDGVVRRHRRAARVPDLVDDEVGCSPRPALAVGGGAEVVHDDVCMPSAELQCVGPAEPVAGAGDDDGTAGEIDGHERRSGGPPAGDPPLRSLLRVGTDTVGYGVQVVFIPSGAVSLWFFSSTKNQQLLCGCS